MDAFVEALESTFSRINLLSTDVVLLGDFNATSSTWCALDDTSDAGRTLEQVFLGLDLHQCVSTRSHMDVSGRLISLLDLLLVSNEQLVHAVDTLPPLSNCDHLPAFCSLTFSLRSVSRSAPRQIWCYDKADFEKLNTTLSKIDWSPVEDAPDIDASWSVWLDIYLGAVRKHVPSKFIKSPKPKLPWMTPVIEQMINLKCTLFRRYKRTKSDADDQLFNHQRNKVTKVLRRAERAYMPTLYRNSRSSGSSAANASQSFWDFKRSLSGKVHRPPIPDLESTQQDPLSSPQPKAEALIVFFVKQTYLEDRDSCPDASTLPNPERLTSYVHHLLMFTQS